MDYSDRNEYLVHLHAKILHMPTWRATGVGLLNLVLAFFERADVDNSLAETAVSTSLGLHFCYGAAVPPCSLTGSQLAWISLPSRPLSSAGVTEWTTAIMSSATRTGGLTAGAREIMAFRGIRGRGTATTIGRQSGEAPQYETTTFLKVGEKPGYQVLAVRGDG